MTNTEFKDQITRLIEVYSEKSYPDERVKILWEENKRLSAFEFQGIVTELIASNSTAPMAGKFREARAMLQQKNAHSLNAAFLEAIERAPQCSWCEKQGCITAYDRATRNEYLFKCRCTVGDMKFPKFPEWGTRFTAQYDLSKWHRKGTAPTGEEIVKVDVSKLINMKAMPMPSATEDDFE
jgi:hypothetical protein